MEVQAEPVIRRSEEGSYEVELVGQGLGAVIGRRGETLDAIQQLTSYSVNRGASKRVRVHIDAEHYRDKREESLQRLALKVAGKVVKYRKSVTLEAMNAYERHVIHTALQEYPDVTTYSTGTEPTAARWWPILRESIAEEQTDRETGGRPAQLRRTAFFEMSLNFPVPAKNTRIFAQVAV